MAAAGIALIAGGLATMVCFRALLFGRGGRHASSSPPAARRPREERRRTRSSEPVAPDSPTSDEVHFSGLASPRPEEEDEFSTPNGDPIADEPVLTPPEPYCGDRIAGWVRPEYQHVAEEPAAGEYWLPIPVDLEPDPEPSAKGYGWPAPVERLPAAGDYELAPGFDLLPVEPEATEVHGFVVPDERRVRLSRNWAARNDKRDRPRGREWRTENDYLFADNQAPTTTRRRPRPRRSADLPDRSTRVYVSRHAAEPPLR